jgi:hypothetical protein
VSRNQKRENTEVWGPLCAKIVSRFKLAAAGLRAAEAGWLNGTEIDCFKTFLIIDDSCTGGKCDFHGLSTSELIRPRVCFTTM